MNRPIANPSPAVLGGGRKMAALFATMLFVGVALFVSEVPSLTPPAAAADEAQAAQTKVVVEATTAFLKSLGDDQKKKVQFTFTPQKTSTAARFEKAGKGGKGGGKGGGFVGEKYGEAVWSNFPVDDVPRPGLRLGRLKAESRDAAMKLLQAVLSKKGYQKTIEIMGSDQALADSGTPFAAGNDAYTLGIFGTPSVTDPWMLQFGGHHLALNVVIAGERGVSTPTMTGMQPAIYKLNGKTVRVLAAENDKAFDLLNSLTEAQRKQAVLKDRVSDLLLGPGQEGKKLTPEGVKGSSLDEKQREKLLDLISEWAGIVNDVYAKPRMEQIKAGLDDTHFAWSGPTTREEGKNGSAYYRIQGPKVVIEYAPQGGGPGGPGMGGPTMHVHTVYRDPTNDYGREFTLAK